MRILFVSRWFPYPVDNGSKIRVYNLIRALARNHQIDLISFTSQPVLSEQISMMNRYCQHIATVNYRPGENNPAREILGFLSSKPRSIIISHHPEMHRILEQFNKSRHYDILISSQIDMAAYTQSWTSSPMIFEELELTGLYESQFHERNKMRRWRRQLMWMKTKAYVKRLLVSYNGCTVVSDVERRRLKDIAPDYDRVEVIPNGVDTDYLSGTYGDVEPDTMIYSGALSYSANLDAMVFFLKAIFPLIKHRRPDAKLYITGNTDGVDLTLFPEDDNVIFTGYLNDIRPRIANSMVSIVPLRFGGGTRLKILESLALRTPVVTTQKGCEGLDLVPDHDLLIADDPFQFAEAVLHLFDDREFREQVALQGCATVRHKYDWSHIGVKLNNMIEAMV